ncbi:MAG: hypothetical protein Kow002_21630 [Anaerolineales bacterium]
MHTLVLVSATTEWTAVKETLQPKTLSDTPYGESFDLTLGNYPVTLLHTGWGKTASAGAMQYALNTLNPDITINLGTCGGIKESTSIGETILVERTLIYDVLDLMGATSTAIEHYASTLNLNLLPQPYPHPVRRGTLASADSDLLPKKIPFIKSLGAIAADWESGALAWVANKNRARLLILRTVSDLVSEQGGEAYGNIQLYQERTQEIMQRLLAQLPDWLAAIEPQIR